MSTSGGFRNPRSLGDLSVDALARGCTSHTSTGAAPCARPPSSLGVGGASRVDDRVIAIEPPILESTIDLSAAIVRVAKREWCRWNQPRRLTERQDAARPMLQTYWRIGPGWTVSDAQLQDAQWQQTNPWSAAFISYVMRTAGAGRRFRYAAKHAVYVRWAIENRLQNRESPFKAFRIDEVAPAPGDLVGKERNNSGANYESIQAANAMPDTHCDVVTEVGARQVTTIGGNVGQSVSQTLVSLGEDGRIDQAGYFVVIKVQGTVPFDVGGANTAIV